MRTHNTGVVSSIPPCVTFKTSLARKATGNHLMNSTSLEKKTQSPFSGCCYARNLVCDAEYKKQIPSAKQKCVKTYQITTDFVKAKPQTNQNISSHFSSSGIPSENETSGKHDIKRPQFVGYTNLFT